MPCSQRLTARMVGEIGRELVGKQDDEASTYELLTFAIVSPSHFPSAREALFPLPEWKPSMVTRFSTRCGA